jgi:hypothetical protein
MARSGTKKENQYVYALVEVLPRQVQTVVGVNSSTTVTVPRRRMQRHPPGVKTIGSRSAPSYQVGVRRQLVVRDPLVELVDHQPHLHSGQMGTDTTVDSQPEAGVRLPWRHRSTSSASACCVGKTISIWFNQEA